MWSMCVSVRRIHWLGGILALLSNQFLGFIDHCILDILGSLFRISPFVGRVLLFLILGVGMTIGAIDEVTVR
jgi:hypothetical protein